MSWLAINIDSSYIKLIKKKDGLAVEINARITIVKSLKCPHIQSQGIYSSKFSRIILNMWRKRLSCMHGHTYTHTYTHAHTHTDTPMHAHTHTHTDTPMYTHRRTHIHTYACLQTHTHTHTQTQKQMHACMHVRALTQTDFPYQSFVKKTMCTMSFSC